MHGRYLAFQMILLGINSLFTIIPHPPILIQVYMKIYFFLFILLSSSMNGYSKEELFNYSSDPLLEIKQPLLKYGNAFVFIPMIKMERSTSTTLLNTVYKELEQFVTLVKNPVFKSEGADLSVFSHPPLTYTIEQLVDDKNKPLPVLKASLTVSNFVDIIRSGQNISLNTNTWYAYVKSTNDVKKVIQTSMPIILKAFISDFQKANPSEKKPTVYICYDDSDFGPIETKSKDPEH